MAGISMGWAYLNILIRIVSSSIHGSKSCHVVRPALLEEWLAEIRALRHNSYCIRCFSARACTSKNYESTKSVFPMTSVSLFSALQKHSDVHPFLYVLNDIVLWKKKGIKMEPKHHKVLHKQ